MSGLPVVYLRAEISRLQAENAQLREELRKQVACNEAQRNNVAVFRDLHESDYFNAKALRADLERKTKALEWVVEHSQHWAYPGLAEICNRAREALAPPTTPEPCFRRCAPGPDREVCAAKSGLIITRCICECHEEPGGEPKA